MEQPISPRLRQPGETAAAFPTVAARRSSVEAQHAAVRLGCPLLPATTPTRYGHHNRHAPHPVDAAELAIDGYSWRG